MARAMTQGPDFRAEQGDRPEPPRDNAPGVLLWFAAVLIAGVLTAWLWPSQREETVLATAPVQPASAPQASPPATPATLYPLAPPESPLRADEIDGALAELLGSKSVATFLQADAFARRVVSTIDNLGRAHAPVAAWPVLPTQGRFTVEERTDGPVIAAENAARYTPFVLLAGTLEVERTVRLYRRMYPLLQQSYRELGFGDRYLNDRVVEVIDLLLAAPEPAEPPRLQLTEVKGPVVSTRPWVRYEYVDPQLESLTAGQKILVRVGPVNERRLKAKLSELRAHIVAAGVPPPMPEAASSAPVPAR